MIAAWHNGSETTYHVEDLLDAFSTACGIDIFDEVYSNDSTWKLIDPSKMPELNLCPKCKCNLGAIADLPMAVTDKETQEMQDAMFDAGIGYGR